MLVSILLTVTVTVSCESSYLLLFVPSYLTRIVVVPSPTALIFPVESTVTILALLDTYDKLSKLTPSAAVIVATI